MKTDKELAALKKERDLLQQHIRQEHQKDSNIDQNRSRETNQYKARIEQYLDELNEARELKLHAEQIAAAAQRELLKERSVLKTNSSLIEVRFLFCRQKNLFEFEVLERTRFIETTIEHNSSRISINERTISRCQSAIARTRPSFSSNQFRIRKSSTSIQTRSCQS